MGTIARGTKSATGTVNFGASTPAKSSEVNTDLNTIVTAINGNIENVNIKSDAAIAATKLNLATVAQNVAFTGNVVAANIQLTTSTLITAILDEDNMASNSAVAIPTQQSVKAYVDANGGGVSYSDARFKVGTFTRDMEAASGDVAITGVGFVPKMLFFFAGKASTAGAIIQYFGAVQNPNVGGVTLNRTPADATGPYIWTTSSNCIGLIESGLANQMAVMKTYDADGFTLTWTKTGSPSANTLTMGYVAFR
jgi:hypothetical protein